MILSARLSNSVKRNSKVITLSAARGENVFSRRKSNSSVDVLFELGSSSIQLVQF